MLKKKCRHCSKPTDSVYCSPECRLERITKDKNLRIQKHNRGHAEGTCTKCNKPRLGNITLCEKCYFRKAAADNLGSTVYAKFLRQQWEKQQGICYYTGLKLELGVNASVDHLKPRKTHPHLVAEPDNVVWCVKEVNSFKGAIDDQQLIEMCRLVAERHPRVES